MKKKVKYPIWGVFIIVLVGTLVLEFWLRPHKALHIQDMPFFYAWFGFASCAAIIIISKILGFFLKRPEDYYGGKE